MIKTQNKYPHEGTINYCVIQQMGFSSKGIIIIEVRKAKQEIPISRATRCAKLPINYSPRALGGPKKRIPIRFSNIQKRPGGYDNQIADSRK